MNNNTTGETHTHAQCDALQQMDKLWSTIRPPYKTRKGLLNAIH